jgi:MFS family permease
VERQQLKWLAYTGVSIAVALLGGVASGYVSGEYSYPTVLILSVAIAGLTIGVPMAIGLAMLRHHLYDVDLFINRTLVYGSLTVMLALIYFGGVATTQAIFRALTGQEQQPQLAVVVSTLAIAALFMPLRRRIQSFIDRLFYRRKYDARKTLEAFSAKLRNETDLEALSEDLVGVVRETMQPAHVSLWLRPEASPKGAQAD